MTDICKDRAIKHLNNLRTCTEDYYTHLFGLRREIRKGNLSLTSLGTKENEIKALVIKGCKTSALGCLSLLRQGSEDYEVLLSTLRKDITTGGFSLKAIRTSETELEKLRILGCKKKALSLLRILREGTNHYNMVLGDLNKEVKKGNFTLADIGTSELELGSLVRSLD